MTQFHEGQEVEVRGVYRDPYWRSGKIVSHEAYLHGAHEPDRYFIEFPDGTRAVLDAHHIRAFDAVDGVETVGGVNEDIAARVAQAIFLAQMNNLINLLTQEAKHGADTSRHCSEEDSQ